FRVFESVIPSGDHDNHLKEFSKNPNKGYYKHALISENLITYGTVSYLRGRKCYAI
ncbi:MAG: hypothetical protein PWP49_517, partial [Thermococcaceae archaeon]|nr:hypothetical protein [Thermococcaceae archaeon]